MNDACRKNGPGTLGTLDCSTKPGKAKSLVSLLVLRHQERTFRRLPELSKCRSSLSHLDRSQGLASLSKNPSFETRC